MAKPSIPLWFVFLFLLLRGSATAAEDFPASPNLPLSAAQERLLHMAASGFVRNDPAPAQAALPSLENSYMGPWVAYWSLQPTLATMTPEQYTAFASRHPHTTASYLLRRQWLLELGHRLNWKEFSRVYEQGNIPHLRSIQCDAYRDPWLAASHPSSSFYDLWQKAAPDDSACNAAARNILAQGGITQGQLWRRIRQFYSAWAYSDALQFAPFFPRDVADQLPQTIHAPAAWVERSVNRYGSGHWPEVERQLLILSLLRLAAEHPAQAMQWTSRVECLSPLETAQIRYVAAFNAALSWRPEALRWYEQARAADPAFRPDPKIMAWMARAALRDEDWPQVVETIQHMAAAQRARREWQFWSAVALQHLGHPQTAQAELTAVAEPWTFYGQLAMADLGISLHLVRTDPPRQEGLVRHLGNEPGFQRALELYKLGVYEDALKEWDHQLQPMENTADRRAAARLAFLHHAWLLGIHTSATIPHGADWTQSYVLPYAQTIAVAAHRSGISEAFLAGIIRQESGFAVHIHSCVGAVGLMQIMPGTARWLQSCAGPAAAGATAQGMRGNVLLGSEYLHLMEQRFSGSELLAAAAYNAGPGTIRRWLWRWTPPPNRWGGPIFAANIPYGQTRHYVENVLTNTNVYAAILSGQPQPIWPELSLGH